MKEIEQWKMSLTNAEKSINTINGYTNNVYELTDWLKKEKQLSEITFETIKLITLMDLQSFMHYLIKVRNNSPSTRTRKTNAIKEFFKFLKKNKLIQENLAEDLKCPKIPKREKAYLNEAECQMLLDNIRGCHEERDIAIVMTFLSSGIRLEEMEKLNIDDIKETTIEDQIYYYLKVIGKGNKERIVPIDLKTINIIKRWLEIRPDVKPDELGRPLFISERKNRLTRKPIYWMIKRALKRIGRSDCSPHSLRHSFATNYLNKPGGNIKTLQKALGHEDIKTTSCYLHTTKHQVILMSNLSSLNNS